MYLQQLKLSADVSLEAEHAQTQLEALLTTDEANLLIDLISDDRRAAEAAASYPCHQSRSSERYWIASERCSGWMEAECPRSAIVRATLRMRS